MQAFLEKIAAFLASAVVFLGIGASPPPAIPPVIHEDLSCILNASNNPAVVGDIITLTWVSANADKARLTLATEKGAAPSEVEVPITGSQDVEVVLEGLLPYTLSVEKNGKEQTCEIVVRSYMRPEQAKKDSYKDVLSKPNTIHRDVFFVEITPNFVFHLQDDSAQIKVLSISHSDIQATTEIQMQVTTDDGIESRTLKGFEYVDIGTYTINIEKMKPLTLRATPISLIPPVAKAGVGTPPQGSGASLVPAPSNPSVSATPVLRGVANGVSSIDVRILDMGFTPFAVYPVAVNDGKWELQVKEPLVQGRYYIEFGGTAMPGGYYQNLYVVTEETPIITFGVASKSHSGEITTHEAIVQKGKTFTLTWKVKDSDHCTLSDYYENQENVSTKGSKKITAPNATSTLAYTLECTNGPEVGQRTPSASSFLKVRVQSSATSSATTRSSP